MIRRTLRGSLAASAASAESTRDPQVRVDREQPGAVEADQRRLAGVAEDEQQEALVAVVPGVVQPVRDLEVEARRAAALHEVPLADELGEAAHRPAVVAAEPVASR